VSWHQRLPGWQGNEKMKYYLESLGCPKNLVDAQGMARLLKHLGYSPVSEPGQAQVLIVNTCGFIEEAREESLDELHQLAQQKRSGQVLIAAGCLSQRWGQALLDEVPGLDGLLGTRRWAHIGTLVEAITQASDRKGPLTLLGDPALAKEAEIARVARQGASAYLKIADGCSAHCAFCAIPLIKGPAASRPAKAIVEDAAKLVLDGAKEIILIAQDTTAYGRDRGERDALPGLIRAMMTKIDEVAPDHAAAGLPWLRIMYAYPSHVSTHLVEVMVSDPRVCSYLDLPLQHAHPDVLRLMKRPAKVKRTRRLIAELRQAMPGIALRTSFILGYPGETEYEFETLLAFMSEMRFDRVGGFLFSPEEGTPAAALPDPVSEEVKEERLERLMALQQQISLELNQDQVGRTLDVLVEGQGEDLSIGRSYRDAPEIDGLVLIPGSVAIGEIVPVRITGAMEYDLVGEVIEEN
jgi:ribosomal protein S12 methylthiotransferase